MAVVYRCVGILTVDVVFFHSQDSFPSTFRPRLWETSSGVVAVGVFASISDTILILFAAVKGGNGWDFCHFGQKSLFHFI